MAMAGLMRKLKWNNKIINRVKINKKRSGTFGFIDAILNHLPTLQPESVVFVP